MTKSPNTLARLRGVALIGATIALGISWSFSLLHVRTQAFPLLWAAAMPLLALYYLTGTPRAGWKHLPAAALSVYAVVLWRVSSGYGLLGQLSVGVGVAASLAVFWLTARWTVAAGDANRQRSAQAVPVRRAPVHRRTRTRRRPA